jgi:hypothetical protein
MHDHRGPLVVVGHHTSTGSSRALQKVFLMSLLIARVALSEHVETYRTLAAMSTRMRNEPNSRHERVQPVRH